MTEGSGPLLEVLMPIRSAMNARRRRKAAEGLLAMERCWRFPDAWTRCGFGRPVRPSPLLGSLLAWARGGCSQPGSGCGCAAPALGCVHI
jgi:hypothetical protein